jgi:hypothetical protein
MAESPPFAAGNSTTAGATPRPNLEPGGALESERITAGDQLLLQAIAQLERRESVATRLRYQATLHGRQLFGAGSYWQQGRGDQLHVRLELQITGGGTSLLQVSNGRLLWTDQQTPTGRTVTQIDLRRIRADVARAAAKQAELQPGQASWFPIQPELTAYYGGLPRLLSAMSESFTFGPPQAMRYKIDSGDGSEKVNLPVFALVGHWKRSRLAKLLPKVAESNSDAELQDQLASLPPRLPQEVLLLVGQADLFPYRVEYRKLSQPAANVAPAEPYQLNAEPMVLVQFSDVSFDVPIGPGQFDYAPPSDAKWDDLTAEYLDKIRRQREEQLATRNRETTR